jgi:cytochrome c oxidase subunit 3
MSVARPGRIAPTAVIRPRGDRGESTPGAGELGLQLFLVSLSVLFGAAVVAYLVVRNRALVWPPPGVPGLPSGIWVSTGLLLVCSVTVQLALHAMRRGNPQRSLRFLALTLGVALLFIGSQILNWIELYGTDSAFHAHLFAFSFLMLTGLHALHVLGGLGQLGFVICKGVRGKYSWASHNGVRYAATYWHFMTGVWFVLLLLLVSGS